MTEKQRNQYTSDTPKDASLIVAQTSEKSGQRQIRPEEVEEDRAYHALRERISHRWDFIADEAVLENMYNEYYGKMAQNLPDVVQAMTMTRLEQYEKKHGVAIGNKDRLAELSWNHDLGLKKRKIEIEHDEDFRKRVITKETYEIYRKTNGAEPFEAGIRAWEEQRKDAIRAELARESVEYGLSATDCERIFEIVDRGYLDGMKKEYERNRRKILETRSMIDLLEKYEMEWRQVETFVDMAGGAGDVGIGIVEYFHHKKICARIVDVVPDLENYNEYLKQAGLYEETRERTTFELHPLQETMFPKRDQSKTAIVAKHPCGPLKDDIISFSIEHEIPFIMIMSCCQDKLCDHVQTYFPLYQGVEIPDEATFQKIVKASATTNVNPEEYRGNEKTYQKMVEKRIQGNAAMQLLDTISAARLQTAGYETRIETVGHGKINKGNVIIAWKST